MVVTTVEASMTENYHLPDDQLWVVYLGQLVGILIGTALSATLQPVSESLLRRRSSGSPIEEHRLALLAMVSFLWPVGFLGYGWSIDRLLPVAVPIIFTGVLGIVRVIMLVSFFSKLSLMCDQIFLLLQGFSSLKGRSSCFLFLSRALSHHGLLLDHFPNS